MSSILITGKGGAGSWKIRGEQLGKAIGAKVVPNAPIEMVKAADVVVIVKKIPPGYESVLKHAKKVIWDVVDAWPQPLGNAWTKDQAINYILSKKHAMGADKLICATRQMAEDLGGDVVYHHHWPNAAPIKIRHHVKRVVYEGDPRYLSYWRPWLEEECKHRGWEFFTGSLAGGDIAVAFRGGEFAGYAPDHWKSNVKLANAQGYGMPFVGFPERGYKETASGAELWARTLEELTKAFDYLQDSRIRYNAAIRMRDSAYSLDKAAEDYLKCLKY